MFNISDFQMVENSIICNAKLLRDEIPKWEVISKYEDVVLQSQGGQWGFQYYRLQFNFYHIIDQL